MTLAQFNQLSSEDAHDCILRCCGSRQWATRMTASRPFADVAAMAAAAQTHWRAMDEADYLQAFAAHPKIGERDGGGAAANTAAMASAEQAGAADASHTTRDELAQLNREYEAKFGFIFIVCASSKSGDEMLQLLRARLPNDRAVEIAAAAAEQLKITQLRIHKLFSS